MKLIKTNDQGMHHLKICVHGDAGTGKTRLCATTGDAENTVIISAEGGLLSLRNSNTAGSVTQMRQRVSSGCASIQFLK